MSVQLERDFYDVAALAQAFGLSERKVRQMAAGGELPARKVGGKYLFSSLALHAWLSSRPGPVPHGEPSADFHARLAQEIETLRPLLERLAEQ
jgi:excisionase family DNA binding protein